MVKFLSVCVLMAFSALAQSETFFDPTRPPAGLFQAAAGPASDAESPLVLQSVLLGPQRQMAVISGQRVSLGQSIGAYKLRSLNNRQAELEGPKGRLTLWLLPAQTPSQQGDRK